MYRLFLALRYLWSRPISWVSMVGIWLTVMATIATISIMSGFLRDTRSMIRGTTSDIVVTPDARPASGTGGRPAPTFAEIQQVAAGVAGVRHLSPHLLRPALLRVPTFSAEVMGNRRYTEMNFVQVIGLDPELEKGATDFDWNVRRLDRLGDPPADPDHPFEIDRRLIPREYRNANLPVALVGDGLYDWFSLGRGKVISLVTMPEDVPVDAVKPLSQRFLVAGSVRTGYIQHDQGTVYVHLEDARRFAETSADLSEVCVAAEPGVDIGVLKVTLRDALAAAGLPVKVETWEDRHEDLLDAVENERSIMGVLLGFFVLIACFNVFATLTIMVNDKIKDIGVLNAMGASPRGLLEIFVGCGFIMTLFSASLGVVTGVLVALEINRIAVAVEWLFGVELFPSNIYAFTEIPVEIHPWFVGLVFLTTLVVAVLCAFLPALRAARMDPVQALRYE